MDGLLIRLDENCEWPKDRCNSHSAHITNHMVEMEVKSGQSEEVK